MAVKIIKKEDEELRQKKLRIQRAKKRRRKRLIRNMIFFVMILLLAYFGFKTLVASGIKKEITIQIGDPLPSASEFITSNWLFGYFKGDFRSINTQIAGKYSVILNVYGIDYKAALIIKDSAAPLLKLKDKKLAYGKKILADDFVESVSDDSQVQIDFKIPPDFEKLGSQEVQIIAKDLSGNETQATAQLEIFKDNVAPVFHGVSDKVVSLGDKVSYRSDVKVSDNVDEDLDFEVDSSNVNLSQIGEYTVVYSAVDSSGNKATKSARVIVRNSIDASTTDINDLNALADEVLARIIKDDMTYLQKLRAIYDYVHDEISYVGRTDRTGRIDAAYDAMKYKRGDCYNFYAVSMTLIDRIGGESIYIARTPKAETKHFWILVKYNDKWYHFDPSNSPTRKNFDCFMKSDPEVEEFTKRVWNIIAQYYEYDKENYPVVSQEPLEM